MVWEGTHDLIYVHTRVEVGSTEGGGGERTKLPLAEKRGRCFWRDRPRGEVKFRPTVVDGMNLLK